MYTYYLIAIKSSRGFKIFKHSSHMTPQSHPIRFNDEVIGLVKEFYFNHVADIEILSVEVERHVGRL